MNQFRTELHIDENPDKIEYGSKIMSMGSGFSNMLTQNLEKYRFSINSNPYGNIYNPISIFNAIETTVNNTPIDERLITESDGMWNHYNFHAQTGAYSKDELITQLNSRINETHESLQNTDFLMLTFGSAYVYKTVSSNKVVSNCHRAPKNDFNKSLLSPEEIVEGFRKVYSSLNNVKNIILVVSPVMHMRDSLTLNAVSKSVLRLACHMIMSEFPYVKYFPAYEFLLSDLRDYRFYEKDLIHPTEQAMDYIFDKFVESYIHQDSKALINEVESILDAVELESYNPQSDDYKTHIQNAIKKIEALSDKMDLSEQLSELNDKLK